MKVLTIAIPVYNTEKYISRCLDSLLIDEILGDIEIITINDGSKDGSINVLKSYKDKYPQTIKIIDKENGGHGSGVNVGLENASGKYFRVIDSDDWVNSTEFIQFINNLKNDDADLVITNYSKEYVYNGNSELLTYKGLEDGKKYDIDKIDLSILNGEYFVMATSTYKTELLREVKLKLFEKTFYVDMQFNCIPILKLKTFKFYNLDIYRYFIGRPDQSMNLDNFVKNKSNHEKVMKNLIEFYCSVKGELSKNKKEYISLILYYMLITHYYIYCVYTKKGSKETRDEIRNFDSFLKEKDIDLYKRVNKISQIKYNRKINFKFVKYNPNRFSKFITFVGKIRRG